MFDATRFVAGAAVLALIGGSMIVGAPFPWGVETTRTDVLTPGFEAVEVEQGIERIVRDDAGHDLDEKHPDYRYDMDGVAVTSDGTVWITSTYHDSDNDANGDSMGQHPIVWALDRPGTFSAADGIPTSPTSLIAAPDGSLLVIGDTAVRFDGESFAADDGPVQRPVRGGTLWLVGPDDLAGIMTEGVAAARPSRLLAAVWTGWEWLSPVEAGRAVEASGRYCEAGHDGVLCEGPGETVMRYLQGTPISGIAAAPDGSIWAVGGWDGGGGGLYRISPT